MRADRLVAVLLLLQQRGRVTAREVADELEISERTARRDLEALGLAGIPVYSQAGRGGGWRLVGGARTDLSGLTASEARALFLVAGPASAGAPAVRSALRKLVQALPEPFRLQAEAAAASMHVDAVAWGRPAEVTTPRFLDALQQAVIDGVRVELDYVAGDGRSTSRVAHPLGVVAKGASWYFVAGTDAGQRTFRIDRVRGVAVTDQPAIRPEGFDLAAEWRAIADAIDHGQTPIEVRALVDPERVEVLRWILGSRLDVGGPGPDGVEVVIRGYSGRSVAGELAGLGSWIHVTSPEEVRIELADVARQLTELYGSDRPS